MLGKPLTTELQSQPQKVVNVEIVKQFFSANTLSSCREGYAYPVLSIGVNMYSQTRLGHLCCPLMHTELYPQTRLRILGVYARERHQSIK